MSSQPPAVDEAAIQWTDAKSTNGVIYQTGTAVQSTDMEIQGGDVVWWPVTNTPVWVNTPLLVGSVSISGYMLSRSGGKLFDYTLAFKNVGGRMNHYTFYDETGDGYVNNTFQDGIHYIHYNSAHPDIVKITTK